MSIQDEQERLSQNKMLESILRDYKITDMVTVYYSDCTDTHNYGIYCALVPSSQIDQALAKTTCDLSYGWGLPNSVRYHQNGERVEYLRFGNDEGIEPLVIERDFHGIKEDYREISEEFRLFHRLYHDKKTDSYIKIDDAGNETIVVVVKPNRIQIRLKEIRQFLAIREMHLVIQFDCREHSTFLLEELGLSDAGDEHRDEFACWGLYYGESGLDDYKSFSRLLGKRLIQPLPKSKSGFWGFAEEVDERYADFIIGVTEDGDEIQYTSNPDALANYFGANPDAPNYLTPVYFKKQVLDKYYQNPSKYSIEDSYLRCGSLWSLQIDNHHKDKVCVWLGDLGKKLSYEEQLYWRSCNISPEGGVSETYFRRQLLAQFTDSARKEDAFLDAYSRLQKSCEEHLKWQILLPLSREDEHHLKCIRIPATEEQRDFDELVLGLTKILIDSLNEKELNKFIPEAEQANIKGSIKRLETAFQNVNVDDFDEHIAFLRELQELRSSGSAHRKGGNYQKIAKKYGINVKPLSAVIEEIMDDAIRFLAFVDSTIQSGQFQIVHPTKQS